MVGGRRRSRLTFQCPASGSERVAPGVAICRNFACRIRVNDGSASGLLRWLLPEVYPAEQPCCAPTDRSGRTRQPALSRRWPRCCVARSVALPALCGLFQPPRSRDQTQTLLLGPEHEAGRMKSRRRLHLQPGGYGYGRSHILVMFRYRRTARSSSRKCS